MPKALVLTGYGINCERETALACRLAGADTHLLHVRHLMTMSVDLGDYDLICFPGGFSFGDELGAAKAFANRLQHGESGIKEHLLAFVGRGGLILGICNGFQLLVKLGLLPGGDKQRASLTHNVSGKFDNRWCHHRVVESHCVFTQGIESLYLPIRHGEGRLVLAPGEEAAALLDNGLAPLQYVDNPNGSVADIAALCDPTGRIFGMMAHPEAALFPHNHPQWHRGEGVAEGLQLFKNAFAKKGCLR